VRVLKEMSGADGVIADTVMTLLAQEERVEDQVHVAGTVLAFRRDLCSRMQGWVSLLLLLFPV
jgi:hypothetical protein